MSKIKQKEENDILVKKKLKKKLNYIKYLPHYYLHNMAQSSKIIYFFSIEDDGQRISLYLIMLLLSTTIERDYGSSLMLLPFTIIERDYDSGSIVTVAITIAKHITTIERDYCNQKNHRYSLRQ